MKKYCYLLLLGFNIVYGMEGDGLEETELYQIICNQTDDNDLFHEFLAMFPSDNLQPSNILPDPSDPSPNTNLTSMIPEQDEQRSDHRVLQELTPIAIPFTEKLPQHMQGEFENIPQKFPQAASIFQEIKKLLNQTEEFQNKNASTNPDQFIRAWQPFLASLQKKISELPPEAQKTAFQGVGLVVTEPVKRHIRAYDFATVAELNRVREEHIPL